MQQVFDMPVTTDAIDPVVRSLRDAAEPYLGTDVLFGFEVSVSEALTNIVRHSYSQLPDAPLARVRITFQGDTAGVTLDLLDNGKPGPADLFIKVPNLDDIDPLAESGRGLALIRHYAETVDFRADRAGNHLHLFFRAGAAAQP